MRTPLRKLLKHRPVKPKPWECSCEHPRNAHAKRWGGRRFAYCMYCDCTMAASKPRKPRKY